MMPLLALAMIVVVILQYFVSRRVWRVSVWKERYKIYKAVEEFMGRVGGEVEPLNGAVTKVTTKSMKEKECKALKGVRIWDVKKFGKQVEARRLLFGKDVNKFVDEVFKMGLAIAAYGEVGDMLEEERKKDDRRMAEKKEEIQEWFEQKYGKLHVLFGKYLKLMRK